MGCSITEKCEAQVILRKKANVKTDNTCYEDGVLCISEDEDLAERFNEQYLTIPLLLEELSDIAHKRLCYARSETETLHWLDVIEACDGWELLETRCE